MNRFGKPCRLE